MTAVWTAAEAAIATGAKPAPGAVWTASAASSIGHRAPSRPPTCSSR